MEDFNEQAYQLKMKKPVEKLLAQLSKKDIHFMAYRSDELPTKPFKNVIFVKADKMLEMSEHSFYGYSRMCLFTKDHPTKENQTIKVDVTDDMYMQMFIRVIVENHFK